MVGDLVGHRAQQKAPGTSHALVADDDQIRLALLGDVENGVGGVALARIDIELHARLAGDLAGRPERYVDVLARIDRPLQVLGRLATFLAKALRRHRLIRADDLQLGANRPCEVNCLAHRLSGRIRAVRPNHDRLEHESPCLLAHAVRWTSKGDHILLGALPEAKQAAGP